MDLRRRRIRTGIPPVVLRCRRRHPRVWTALIILLSLTYFPAVFWPVSAADPSPVQEAFPLTIHSYKASLVTDSITGTVGEAVILSFTLDPPDLPPGFFISVIMKQVAGPEDTGFRDKPEILTGFPDTRMVFHSPGRYRYTAIVSMIAKSSCGGVEADTIFNGEVQISVSAPD